MQSHYINSKNFMFQFQNLPISSSKSWQMRLAGLFRDMYGI